MLAEVSVNDVTIPAAPGMVEAMTDTATDWLAEPPVPVHVSVKIVAAVKMPESTEPEVAFVPDHPPEALQEVALLALQVRVEELPEGIELGLADNKIVGGAGVEVTVTVTDWFAEPSLPVQLSV